MPLLVIALYSPLLSSSLRLRFSQRTALLPIPNSTSTSTPSIRYLPSRLVADLQELVDPLHAFKLVATLRPRPFVRSSGRFDGG